MITIKNFVRRIIFFVTIMGISCSLIYSMEQPSVLSYFNAGQLETDGQKFSKQFHQGVKYCQEEQGKISAKIQNLRNGSQSVKYDGITYTQAQIGDLQALYDQQGKNIEYYEDTRKSVTSIYIKGAEIAMQVEQSEREEEARRRTELGRAAIGEAEKTKRLKEVLNFFKNPDNIGYIVGGIAATLLSYYLIKHGVGITAHYIEQKLGKPQIIKATSRVTFFDRLLGKKKETESRMSEFVAAPVLKRELQNIADDTLRARMHGDKLTSVLLYGPPGTGKTMFAKALAIYSGLDWALIPGSSLSKLDTKDALAKLQDILTWARNSKKGTILIWDEVENFLRNRGDGKMSEGSQKLITEFLAQVERPSDEKLMFVLTTNRPKDLDPAALSRVGRYIHFPAPAHDELVDLFKVYVSKVRQHGLVVAEGLEGHYDAFARDAKGLVGRDVEEIFTVQAVREVRRTGTRILTYQAVSKTLQRYLQERNERLEFVGA